MSNTGKLKVVNQNRLSDKQLVAQYEELVEFLKKYIKSDRWERINAMLNDISERLALAPASPADHGAYPGGLIEHMLDNGKAAIMIREVYHMLGLSDLPSLESTVLASTLHDLGKVGDDKEDNYIVEESQWHRENLGRMYKQNENAVRIHHSDKSLYMFNHYKIVLTTEEFQAIRAHDGPGYEGNKHYTYDISMLAKIVYMADYISSSFRNYLYYEEMKEEN